jgi:hypothetical protein
MVKVVADVTEQTKQISQKIFNFPEEVSIKEAIVIIDEWKQYYLIIKYEMDGVMRTIEKHVTETLEGSIYSILEQIKDYYQRMHVIQF